MNTQQNHAFFYSLKEFDIGSVLKPIKHLSEEGTQKSKLEEALEITRLCEYKTYPSRLRCIFVASTEESANEWFKSIKAPSQKFSTLEYHYYVYELVTHENIYWFNADILHEIVYKLYKGLDEIAKDYWDSCVIENPNHKDCKMEGIVKGEMEILKKKRMLLDKDRVYKEII